MLCANKRCAVRMTDLIKAPYKLLVVHEPRVTNNVVKNYSVLVYFARLSSPFELCRLGT